MDIPSSLALAGRHIEAGHLAEAEGLYRQVLGIAPDEPHALYGLGFVALMAHAYEDSIRLISAAVKKAPRAGAWQLTLGDAFRYAGKLPEAVKAYEKAAKLLPNHPMAHNNLGAAYEESGEHRRAAQAFHRAVDLAPSDPQYHTNLGTAFQKLKDNRQAIQCFEKALALAPDYVLALINLGVSLIAEGRFQEAIAPLERSISLLPETPEPRHNLAIALRFTGQTERAIGLLRESLAHKPTPLIYSALSEYLRGEHRLTEAEAVARDGIARFPSEARLRISLGQALSERGAVSEAIAAYREAQQLANDESVAAAGIAFLLTTLEIPAPEQFAAAQAAARTLGRKPLKRAPPAHRPAKLRIGYVSPDFRRHSVAYFFEGLLRSHDRGRVEIFCYSATEARDDMTGKLQGIAQHWRDIGRLGDDEAARLMLKDGIHVLVDLAGYTTGNRLGIFTRQPAPVQMTYLGYPNSTGLSAIDFRLTDAIADPPALTDPYYTERLIRLPRVFLAYTAPNDTPEVSVLPCIGAGHITFGSFNAVHKFSDQTLDLWAEVLRAVPGSRLLLKAAALTDDGVRKGIMERFSIRNIASDRLTLLGYAKQRADHLATYHQIDIGLDTFPYGGTTTTCEALYMGIPVITLAGATHASRVGASLLSSVGLEECVATTPEAYAAQAAAVAADIDALAALRASLRNRMRASPLMDAHGLARAVEAAFAEAWDKHQEGKE